MQIDEALEELDRGTAKRVLNGLEADIWRGVETRHRNARVARAVLGCQIAVLAVGLLTSITAGTQVAMNSAPHATPSVLSVAANLSPSARLIGR